jgi:alanine-synthesizing transaminase
MSGPRESTADYREGLTVLANMRLCPNVPAQHGVQAALGGPRNIREFILPGGRLAEQRDVTWKLLNDIPGVSCTKPQGALYAFPRLDPKVHPVEDDEQLALEFVRQEHVLVVPGSGFNWPQPDHLRIVTLPRVEDLEDALERFARFLDRRRQALS